MTQEVNEFIADLLEAAQKADGLVSGAVDACRPVLLEAINQNFRTQSTAGSGWPVRRDQGFSHPLLAQSGALMAAASTPNAPGHIERLTTDATGALLEIGVDTGVQNGGIPGAAAHNYGATIVPVAKKFLSWINSAGQRVFAKSVTIPQREFMAVGDDTVDQCGNVMADKMLKEVL